MSKEKNKRKAPPARSGGGMGPPGIHGEKPKEFKKTLRSRAPRPRQVRPRLPDAARWLRRPGAGLLRRQGAAPAGEERAGGRRPGGAPVQRRAQRRRGVPHLDGACRRGQGHRRRPARPRRVPRSGRASRVLRRLRRDRSVQRRDRRVGVRGLEHRHGTPIGDGRDRRRQRRRPDVIGARRDEPLALAHGRLAAEWIDRLVPDADDTLKLAARAHHLRRWELPRADYPEGRAGYLRWRRDQKRRHAADVEALLVAAGYDADDVIGCRR